MFRASAGKYPDKVALIFGGMSLTYQALDRWTDAVASMLHDKGIGPGQSVGLWWPRSLELHVAILGIVKSGAAYVPLDREMPAERVHTVLTEVGASACFTDGDFDFGCPAYRVPVMPAASDSINAPAGPAPDDRAYVLYTSGSTGKPKGIPISHRQICHLVRSEQTLLEITAEDRIYQGFSVSFDMWCEEVWIGLHAGATLWVADATTAKVIDELESVLREQKITVLSAVPSLLAVMDDDIPTLRLVNAGGEACTPQVLARWATKGRKFYNSYGPTETTVSATFAALKPGDHITIGQPLPNYNMAVVDEHLNLLPNGEKGELVISGPGVCAGYVNRPDLTAEKFVKKSPSLAALPGDIIYRTGDAAIINADGSIDFQGRLDDQIKLRGYRIELGEIESQLNSLQGVSAAAVAVRKDNNGQDELVGYAVLDDGVTFDESHLRNDLAKVLPPYMVPGVIMVLPEMPRLPSGKIDRKSLPTPTSFSEKPSISNDEKINATGSVSERVIAVLKKVFPGREINLSEDFFTDLGGHSLLAATLVSRLRKEAGLKQASLRDVYQQRPLTNLVSLWEEKNEDSTVSAQRPFHTIPTARYVACWIAQSISLVVIYGLFSVQIFLPYLGYYYWQQRTESHGYAMIAALCLFCVIPPIFSLISVIVKWTVIGRFKPGDYPLWGTYYFRWWLVNTVQGLVPMEFLNGTPLFPMYLRMMGVKVADDAQIGAIKIGAEDLVSIGSDASLSSQVLLNNASVEDGLLKIREIKIGDHAYIGSSAVIAGGASIEDWGELQDLSFLPAGKTIRTGEVWKGSPAQCIEKKKIWLSRWKCLRISFLFIRQCLLLCC
jgi:amino acid adenylation domain-containing protein